jgi:hypothetical protein
VTVFRQLDFDYPAGVFELRLDGRIFLKIFFWDGADVMRKSLVGLGAALALVFSASAASASEFIFQWDDSSEGHLYGITFQDGVEIQNVDVGGESYNSSYGMWNGATLVNDFDVAFNIFDLDGLSDTYHIFGFAGSGTFNPHFNSDVDGGSPLTPLANAVSITETGNFQTVYDFTVSNGDHYTLQFRSDVEAGVPEPASWALMIGGFGLIGAAMRRRNAVALQTT